MMTGEKVFLFSSALPWARARGILDDATCLGSRTLSRLRVDARSIFSRPCLKLKVKFDSISYNFSFHSLFTYNRLAKKGERHKVCGWVCLESNVIDRFFQYFMPIHHSFNKENEYLWKTWHILIKWCQQDYSRLSCHLGFFKSLECKQKWRWSLK